MLILEICSACALIAAIAVLAEAAAHRYLDQDIRRILERQEIERRQKLAQSKNQPPPRAAERERSK